MMSDSTLSKMKIGSVVKEQSTISTTHEGDYGHIVGFDRNCTQELILLVKWSREKEPSLIHPYHVVVL